MMQDKIISREQLTSVCKEFRAQGLIIGFTSDAFDLLHAGHVDYLEKAKSLCDKLVVGLNSDDSIKKYNGSIRPIIPELQRQKTIAALESVDFELLPNAVKGMKKFQDMGYRLVIVTNQGGIGLECAQY